MKLKFKNQSYQDDAVRSVVNIFEGQAKGNRKSNLYRHKVGEGLFEHIEDVISFGNNKISLSDSELKDNIRKVQKTNDLPYTNDQGYLNFSIEMETGTGKTFTYIKTMYELNKELMVLENEKRNILNSKIYMQKEEKRLKNIEKELNNHQQHINSMMRYLKN